MTFGVQRIVCRNNIVYLSTPQCGDFNALRLARTIAEFIHFEVQNWKRRYMQCVLSLLSRCTTRSGDSLENGDESQILIVPRGNCYDLTSSRLWPFVQRSSRRETILSGNLLVVDQRRGMLFRLTLTLDQDNVEFEHRRHFWPWHSRGTARDVRRRSIVRSDVFRTIDLANKPLLTPLLVFCGHTHRAQCWEKKRYTTWPFLSQLAHICKTHFS